MTNIVIYRDYLGDIDYVFYRILEILSPHFNSYMTVDRKKRQIDIFDTRIWFCNTDVRRMAGLRCAYFNAYDSYAKAYLGRDGAKEFKIDDIIKVLIEICLNRQQSEFPADAGHERRKINVNN